MAVNDRTRDGRPILTRARLDAYDPRPRRSGAWMRYRCPDHESDHQKSLAVDDEGHYLCHSCGIHGTLQEHWEGNEGKRMEPSMEERGRLLRAARAREEERKRAEFAQELPAEAQAFLAALPSYQAALRDPDCPGHRYLRSRGLDPLVAAAYGAGYCAPGVYPTDVKTGRRHGRVVYPLADPTTGRVVSALGRLCVDLDPAWSPAAQDHFKRTKQRKLADCPSAIWPYAALDQARTQGRALVLMEGPADALALVQASPLFVVAQCGLGHTMPASALRGIDRLVIAFDDDIPGRRATHALRADYLLDLVAHVPPAGWLQGAKDLALLASDDTAAYARAVAALLETAQPWDEARAMQLIAAYLGRCGAAVAGLSETDWPSTDDEAIDAACAMRDWAALLEAIETGERLFRAAVARQRF